MLVESCTVTVGFVGSSAKFRRGWYLLGACPLVLGERVLCGVQGAPGAGDTHTLEIVFSTPRPCDSRPQVGHCVGMPTLLGKCELTCPFSVLVMDNDNEGTVGVMMVIVMVMMMTVRTDDENS